MFRFSDMNTTESLILMSQTDRIVLLESDLRLAIQVNLILNASIQK
jgi:hypothetical protein